MALTSPTPPALEMSGKLTPSCPSLLTPSFPSLLTTSRYVTDDMGAGFCSSSEKSWSGCGVAHCVGEIVCTGC